MKSLFWLLYKLGFYPMFFLSVIILLLAPLMNLQDIFHVLDSEAPVTSFLPVLMIVSFIVYLSFRVPKTQAIYRRFPVLVPFVQMAFSMSIATGLGLECVNVWADDGIFPKWLAASLATTSIVLGRAFMSYWWYKYPISSKLRRAE